ncbi:MAG: FAD-dependent oxidoreductase, partial [Planctomycetota bacterium]|nr:FAD-dependent oxidoreductase [Planctomycetota bacterium]
MSIPSSASLGSKRGQKAELKYLQEGLKVDRFVRLTVVTALSFLPFIQGGCQKPWHGHPFDYAQDKLGRVFTGWKPVPQAVNESARDIPVAYDVDVVVVGGTSGGVAAAVGAAQKGAKVFLAAQRPYLGEDLCSTYQLWLEPGEKPSLPLARKIFAQLPPTPMQIKRALDEALLEAGVQFLYGCYATEVLRDNGGDIAGVVIANRSGRQAVRAKVIIDATGRATVARMAGAVFGPYSSGPQTFKRIVVGGEVQSGNDIEVRKMPALLQIDNGLACGAVEYTLKIHTKDGSFASFAEAEQIARDKTWHRGQEDASETLFQIPPDPIKGKKSLAGSWPGAGKVDLDVFRPVGTRRLFVLGGCADISRDAVAKLLRPLELMEVGGRIGEAAALEAKSIARPRNVRLPGRPVMAIASGDIKENLAGIRTAQSKAETVSADRRAVPVIGEYDV